MSFKKLKILFFTHKELVFLFALFVVVLVSRLYFLGSSPWHDDVFNFINKALILAVSGEYSNAHSTGYPLWVFLLAGVMKLGYLISAKWSIIFLPNLLSAIAGSFLVFPVYSIAKKILDNKKLALFAVIVVLSNPVIWRWSTVAMGDVLALLFALLSLSYFLDYYKYNKIKPLLFSGLFLYLSLMIRVVYGLFFIPFIIFWFKNKKNESKNSLYSFGIFVATLALMLLSYFLINNFSISILFSGYGSTLPSVGEFFKTTWIVLKSTGIFVWFFIIPGFYYLYKNNKNIFYLLSSLFLLFLLYVSSWYHNGAFDIERYAIFLTIILLFVSIYTITVNKIWKWAYMGLFAISVIVLLSGLAKPVNFYQTYATHDNIFTDYKLKASQVAQHKLIDGDVQTYSDLADIIEKDDVVFHWKNDWAIPRLILSGDHLDDPAKLVAIDSEEVLESELNQYSGQKIYLLRGVYDTYISSQVRPRPQRLFLNNRSVVYFIN